MINWEALTGAANTNKKADNCVHNGATKENKNHCNFHKNGASKTEEHTHYFPENREDNTEENSLITQKVGHCPTDLTARLPEVGQAKASGSNGFKAIVRLARPARPLFQGDGNIKENYPPREGVTAEKIRAVKTDFSVHPMAVCLLLSCCQKIRANEVETTTAILKLGQSSPVEQIRSWSQLCFDNGVDPVDVIHPFRKSNLKGNSCQDCKNLNMTSKKVPGERRLYRWECLKHYPILEDYCIAERVLIAPTECTDYSPLHT